MEQAHADLVAKFDTAPTIELARMIGQLALEIAERKEIAEAKTGRLQCNPSRRAGAPGSRGTEARCRPFPSPAAGVA